TELHQDDADVSDLLCSIELSPGEFSLPQSHIVQGHQDGFTERLPGRNQVAPFTRKDGVSDVHHAIDGEEPHEEKVPRHTSCQLVTHAEGVVEPFRKEPEECD